MTTSNFNPTADSWMDYSFPTVNYGSAAYLLMGVKYSGPTKTGLRRPIFRFDVSSLPGGVSITTAKLTLEVIAYDGGGAGSKASRCTRENTWVEGEVTWDDYKSATAWTSAGGDYDDTGPPAAVSFSLPSSNGPFDITGLATQVQDAYDSRSGIYSIILRLDDEDPGSDEGIQFDARSGSTPPVLEVIYPVSGTFPFANKSPLHTLVGGGLTQ